MNGTSSRTPRCIIIAGPNGAGKTTFAREFLPKEAGSDSFCECRFDLRVGFRRCDLNWPLSPVADCFLPNWTGWLVLEWTLRSKAR